jgi:nucleoside 2-deoxyribosyltransferase
MLAVSDRVDLQRSDTGTTVEMGFRVSSPQSANDQRAAENARSDST